MSRDASLPVTSKVRNVQPPRSLPLLLVPLARGFGALWRAYLSTLRIEFQGRDLLPDRNPEPSVFLIWCGKTFVAAAYQNGRRTKHLSYTDWKHLLVQYAVGYSEGARLAFSEYDAVRDIGQALRAGFSVTSLADGPYGPAGELKRGLVLVAARNRCPIVTVGSHPRRSIRVPGRWDRYEMPLPFTTVVITAQRIETRKRSVRDLLEQTVDGLGIP